MFKLSLFWAILGDGSLRSRAKFRMGPLLGERRDDRPHPGDCLRRPKKLLRKVSLDSSNLFDLGNQRELGCGKLGKEGTLGAEHRGVEN